MDIDSDLPVEVLPENAVEPPALPPKKRPVPAKRKSLGKDAISVDAARITMENSSSNNSSSNSATTGSFQFAHEKQRGPRSQSGNIGLFGLLLYHVHALTHIHNTNLK